MSKEKQETTSLEEIKKALSGLEEHHQKNGKSPTVPIWAFTAVATLVGGLMLFVMNDMRDTLRQNTERQIEVMQSAAEHYAAPWHDDAGQAIRQNTRDISVIKTDVEYVKSGVAELLNRTQ